MPKKLNKRIILAKIEATSGTDSAPTVSTNAVLCRNVTVTPLQGDSVERNLIRGFFGSSDRIAGSVWSEVEVEVELQGSGTLGTAPQVGTLLRACSMAETINAGVSVIYKPQTGSENSVTLYTYVDDLLHKLTYAKGTVSFDLSAKAIPVAKFKFTGLFSPVTDSVPGAATMTSWKTPLPVNNTNTSGFSLHGYSGVLSSLSIDLGNSVAYRELIGSTSVEVTDRKTVGKISIEAPSIATKDFFTIAKNSTLGALSITHGVTSGLKVKIDAPSVDLNSPSYSDLDGIAMLDMDMTFVPSAGNDELVLTFI